MVHECPLCDALTDAVLQGILDARGCQVLARMCFYVFTPCLTFDKLVQVCDGGGGMWLCVCVRRVGYRFCILSHDAATPLPSNQAVSLDTISHLWPLPAAMTISTIIGLGMGRLSAAVLRTPPEFGSLVVVAVAFGNVGALPLVFASTLCHDDASIFYRSLGADCERLGVAYVALDIAAATLWQFTVALHLLRPSKGPSAAAAATADLPLGLDAAAGMVARASAMGGEGAAAAAAAARGSSSLQQQLAGVASMPSIFRLQLPTCPHRQTPMTWPAGRQGSRLCAAAPARRRGRAGRGRGAWPPTAPT